MKREVVGEDHVEGVNAGIEQVPRYFIVQSRGHHDADQIHFLSQGLVIAEYDRVPLRGYGSGALRVRIRHGRQFHAVEGLILAGVQAAQMAGAYHAGAQGGGHGFSSSAPGVVTRSSLAYVLEAAIRKRADVGAGGRLQRCEGRGS